MRCLHKLETDKNNRNRFVQEWTRAAHLVDPRLPVAPHQWSCHGNTRMSAECLSIFLPSSSWVPLHTSDLALQAMARNSFKVHTFTFQMVSQHLGRKEEGEEGREGRKKGREGGRVGGREGDAGFMHTQVTQYITRLTPLAKLVMATPSGCSLLFSARPTMAVKS